MTDKRFTGWQVTAAAILITVVTAACTTVPGSLASPGAATPREAVGSGAAGVPNAQNVAALQNVIVVTGTGQAFGQPDFATVDLGIEVTNEDVGEAIDETNTVIDDMTAALTDLGIAEQNIRTTRFNVFQDDVRDPETGARTGERIFRVTNSVQVRVEDVDLISEVIDAALDAGANQVNGLNFSIADRAPLEEDARAQAVENARARAEDLAEELGVAVGVPVRIAEGAGGGPVAPTEFAQEDVAAAGPSIQQGQLSVGVSVTVWFQIIGQ